MLLPLRSSVSIAVQPASAEMSVILLPDRTSVLSFTVRRVKRFLSSQSFFEIARAR